MVILHSCVAVYQRVSRLCLQIIWDVRFPGFSHTGRNCETQLEIQVRCLCLNIIASPIYIKHQLSDPGVVFYLFISGALIGEVSFTGGGTKLNLEHIWM